MDKKDLKFYVAPEMEQVMAETEGFLCNSNEGASLPNMDEQEID